MVLGGADTGEIQRVAANGARLIGQAFKTAGRHLLSDGKALRWVGFAEGTERGQFLGLGLAAVW